MAGPQVRRLRRRQIDDVRWNEAVGSSSRPLPYGLTWWLDCVTNAQWEGLILDDYRTVLPLPQLYRGGFIPSYSRPLFTQQLGPFGHVDEQSVKLLFAAVPHRPYVSIPSSSIILTEKMLTEYNVTPRTNFTLAISKEYDEILQRFPKKLRQYSRRWQSDHLRQCSANEVIASYRDTLHGRGGLSAKDFDVLAKLIAAALTHQAGQCYALDSSEGSLAAGFFPTYLGRTINLATGTTPLGADQRGMTRMLLAIIRATCGKEHAVLDFEGSDLPGVREYFAKFGGQDEGYYVVERKWAILP